MEIQHLGRSSLYIYLREDDLRQIPATPKEITDSDARDILLRALGDTADRRWQNAFLELYPGPDAVLMFARAHDNEPQCFAFGEIDALADAAQLCPDGLISYLIYNEHTYYLTVYPWESEPAPSVLSEYGSSLSVSQYLVLHLAEHGKLLSGPMAIDALKKAF